MTFLSRVIIPTLSLGLLTVTAAWAQQGYGQAGSGTYQNNSFNSSFNGSGEPIFHANQLIGTQAKNFQGQTLGDVSDVLITQNGDIFASISLGSDRFALVPWQAVRVTPNNNTAGTSGQNLQIAINATPDALQNAPCINGQYTGQVSPSFVRKVFSYYKVNSSNEAMGGAGGL